MVKEKNNESLAGSLEELARLHDLTHPDGSINYTSFARRVGLPAPTIMRWHKGHTKDVSTKAVQAICRALNVTEAQVRGMEPVESSRTKSKRSKRLDQRDVDLIVQLRSLPVRKQKDIEKFVDMRLSMTTST